MGPFYPAYLNINAAELEKRVRIAYEHMVRCDVCPANCFVNRMEGELGNCRIGGFARVANYCLAKYEEAVISGWKGSGAIYFANCNMRCQYCCTHEISMDNAGREFEPEELAAIMLELQDTGAHNINLISPSHVVPQILAALRVATKAGFHLPLVYNSGGYDSLVMIKLLESVIDIYLPDMKYAKADVGDRYSRVADYPRVNQAVVMEMHHQVGDLELDKEGMAKRGLLVRHLVLPRGLAGTQDVMRFLAEKISPNTYVSLMDSYEPLYNAMRYPEINRRIDDFEYQEAVEFAHRVGLSRLENGRTPLPMR
jgi:putative pyruvate formate lyase activating enzyme